MSMLNTEKPMVMVVMQSRTVAGKAFSRFSARKMPQKHRASSASRKKAAPVLYGRPSVLTKKRSKYAATFGRYGTKRKTSSARMTQPTSMILTSSQNVKGLSSRLR